MKLTRILRAALATSTLWLAACALPPSGFIHDPDKLAQVRVGAMTVTELEALLGPPLRRLDFPWLGIRAWEYERPEWARNPVYSYTIDKNGVVRGLVRHTPPP